MLAASPRVALSPAHDVSDAPPFWRQMVESLEPFLEAIGQQLVEQVDAFEPELAASARHALTAAGKQLRPTLLGLCARATGGLNPGHVKAAAIIEMVHLATLVHDDVLDEAQIRRGRRTLAGEAGNEHAVLFGDCLFAHALELAASYPTPEVCRAVAAATKVVCTGEILQNQQRLQFDLPQAEYFRVLEMKTAELFALSCELGAFLNDAPAALRAALRRYGLALGTAYQVYDDCLDVFGTEALAGKSLGTDLAHGKLTLPLLLLRETASPGEKKLVQQLLRDWEPEAFTTVLDLLRQHQALNRSLAVVGDYVRLARQAVTPFGPRSKPLLQLADFLARQAEALAAEPMA
jgi:octaprenyl-diphosphate synthase